MESKKDKFIQGIIILMSSQVIIKIFGVIYSIYLTNKTGFGDTGNAIYMGGYQVYILLLSISSIGIPNAISKLVAEKIALKDYFGAKRILKISLMLFSSIGFIAAYILYNSAEFISEKILEIPESKFSLQALAPAIFFVTISSVIRGYCNGRNEMEITAKSQIIEQAFKCFFTIIFVEIIGKFSNYDAKLMAAIANIATTFSTFLSMAYILIKCIGINKKNIYEVNKKNFEKEKIKRIVKRIFDVSFPITISSILSTSNKNIDSFTIVKILRKNLGEFEAKKRYGILSSKIDLILAMPLSFNIAFSTALVPEIAGSLIKNDFENINKKMKFSMLVSLLISFPCAFGIFIYSNQILKLLFPKASLGAVSLKLGAISIVFGALTQNINGALQGIGKNKIPVYALMCGIVVKAISNFLLIPIKNVYEKGAIIGNVFCNIITFCIGYYFLRKSIKLEFKMKKIIIKPVIATIIMSFLSYIGYKIFYKIVFFEYISTIIGILIAIITYIILIFLMKIFEIDELFLLPKGEKIYKILKKMKIY